MRREIALRASVGVIYGVAMFAFLRLSREIDTSWVAFAVLVGVFGVVLLIHRWILRIYESRIVPDVPARQR